MKFDTFKCVEKMAVKGWSQSILAKRAKVSDASVSNFLTGKPVRNTTAKKIVGALGLTMRDVLRGIAA